MFCFTLRGQGASSYDTMPWLRADLLRRNAEVLVDAADIVKRWSGTVPEDVEERAKRLRADLDRSRDSVLKRLGVTGRVTRSMDRSEIGTGTVDLFYSDSVLQLVDPRDLSVLVREARRFLKPSGRCLHVVDCRDTSVLHDHRVPRLAYLAWPEPVWWLLTSRYLNYQNRWRMPQFVKLFENEGFRVRVLDPIIQAGDIAYARRRLASAARFADMSLAEIATSSFLLTGGAAATTQ